MIENQTKPAPRPAQLRLNMQFSVVVENEQHAIELFEEIGIFVKSIQSTAIIGGGITKNL